ncbi:37S ribosomal protein S28, mitochondrial [Wickerhamomyces ciferrii]|uniref:37S ribosomal protein S28, mitochondrial n=1 Tax=Wickerhamomyces ciferrii (strain ATCC 14091 / BCRC 22168 / CBS 111 / JCM 3599 / NBRC 0793 / NRRL Y-1031 F-60-10) TaxID=1206466 RepID=K0KHM9_WICCF|nr:37S ribosomal protein S28, mitochondrial [Wickerhamomyces ciferrii]CCH40874.1 37S ribosomal protein S28, mitochondrial [Wickerhamomyces ciferrii]
MFQSGSILKSIGLGRSFQQLSIRSFSTSSPILAGRPAPLRKSLRYLRANRRKETNILKQRKLEAKKNELDPVLGKKNNAFLTRLEAEVQEPNVLTRGYEKSEVEKLLYGAQEASIKESFASDSVRQSAIKQREAVFRILNMRNRSSAESLKFKTDLARKEFQRFDGDTGSSEVQAAIATVKIHHLFKHVVENFKDFKNIRYMRMLVQQRQKILRYLKKDDPEKYYWTLNKLGLNDHVVHMEFNMDKRYMQEFKWFGDKVLVRDSQKQKEIKRKEKRLEKKAIRQMRAAKQDPTARRF